MNTVGNISITPLLKAFSKFEIFRKNTGTEQEKAGTILAFEYSFELSWKIMKRLLQERGLSANTISQIKSDELFKSETEQVVRVCT